MDTKLEALIREDVSALREGDKVKADQLTSMLNKLVSINAQEVTDDLVERVARESMKFVYEHFEWTHIDPPEEAVRRIEIIRPFMKAPLPKEELHERITQLIEDVS